MRTFQLLRTFGRFELFDLITFGGEGAGAPGEEEPGDGAATPLRRRRSVAALLLVNG